MSGSWLYQAFGVRGYEYVSTRFEQGEMIVRVSQRRESLRCSACGAEHVHVKSHQTRRFRTLPLGHKTVWLELPIAKVWCQECLATRQVEVAFAKPKKHYTKTFARFVVELSGFMTPMDIACFLGISWDTARDILKEHLGKKYGRPKLRRVKHIAIDEVYLGKRHKFITLVLDLDSGAVIFVGEGKSAEALRGFWPRLRASHAQIEAVATDLSAAYISAVMQNLKGAALVFDHFHIIKLMNEKLTQLRRELFHEATTKHQREVLKGTRWLLLSNPENLDPSKLEPSRLKVALALNEPLATAYYLKEDLRQLWNQPSKAHAERFLSAWAKQAQDSGIRVLQQFAKTLLGHRTGLLNWYDHPISTGPLEAANNKLKLLQRRAFGYRDLGFLKLKILAMHNCRFALVG